MKEKKSKTKQKTSRGKILSKSVFTILATLKEALTINKISELPENMYLGKNDKLGFNINRFIKGTQIQQQVFPEPFINAEEKDQLQHYFQIPGVQMEKCTVTKSEKPLEYVSICEDKKIFLHIYNRDMSVKEIYKKEIPSEKDKFIRCDDVNIGENFLYMVCLKEGSATKIYDANFYVLERKKADKDLTLEIVKEEKYEGFIGSENNKDDKVLLTSIQKDVNSTRSIIYQANLGLNKEKTSTKIFIIDFDIQKKETKVISKKVDALKNEVIRGSLINEEYFYAQEKDKGTIFGCKISGSDVDCNQNTRFSFGDSVMSIWRADFNYITKKTVIFFSSEETFRSCIVNKFPVEKDQMICTEFKLDFSGDQKVNLISGNLAYSKNLNSVIISYFKKSATPPLWIAGYIVVDVRQNSAQFTDLKQFQATSMSIVNETYYTLQMGKMVSLHKIAKRKFTISPPKSSNSAKIYLSAYKTYFIDNVQKKENERIKGYVISSTLNKVETDTDQIDIYPINKLTVYNDESYQEFCYNTKQILGNNAKMEISLAGHTFPSKENFVREIKLQGDKMSDKDVKELFLVGKGTFVYTLEGDENNLKVMDCPVNDTIRDETVTCKNYYEGKHEGIKLRNAQLFNIGLFVVVMKPKGTQAEMLLYRFVKNSKTNLYEFQDKQTNIIAEADSHCDLKMYGEVVFTICSNDGKEKGKPEIILNRLYFKNDGTVEVKDIKRMNPEKLGNPNFKKGVIQFKAGSDKIAFTINNNKDDLTLLKIDFDLVNFGLEMAISNKYSLNSHIKDTKIEEYNVQLCQTVSAVFFFEKSTNKIYGANIDYIEQSFLEVPLNGNTRSIMEMQCSPHREAFQVWVKDTVTEDKYLMTYYGFDGTQASKKLHSEYKIKQKTNHLAMASILDDVEGVIHSYLYDESSMFYNQSLIIDLEGPKTYLNYKNVVKGKYQFYVKLSNEKTSKNFSINIDVEEPEILKFKINDISKFPQDPKKTTDLKTYLNWTGPLFDFHFNDPNQKKWVKSLPRVRRIENEDIKITPGKQELLGITEGYYLMKDIDDKGVQTVSLYSNKDKNKVLNKLDLSKYGNSCKNFFLSKDQKEKEFFAVFICVSQLNNTVNIVKMIPNAQSHDLCRNSSRFEIAELKVATDKKSMIVAVREKGGDIIQIFKASKDENKPTISMISLNWRQPGDMSLFSSSTFDISNVEGVDILTVLSKGQNYVRAITLDFENSSILKTYKIYGAKNTSYEFAVCYDVNTALQLVCVVGGIGIKFEQIHIPVDKENKILKFKQYSEVKNQKEIDEIENEKAKNRISYRLPPVGNLNVIGGKFNDDYLIIYGDFGDYKVTYLNELGKFENKKISEVSSKTIEDDIKKRLPNTINFLVYKKNENLVYSILEGDPRKFVALDKEEQNTYLYYQDAKEPGTIRKNVMKPFEVEMNPDEAKKTKMELKIQLVGFEMTNSKFYASQSNVRYFTVQKVSLIFVAVLVGMIVLYTFFMLVFKKKETEKRIERKELGKELKSNEDVIETVDQEEAKSVGSSDSDEERETGEVKIKL